MVAILLTISILTISIDIIFSGANYRVKYYHLYHVNKSNHNSVVTLLRHIGAALAAGAWTNWVNTSDTHSQLEDCVMATRSTDDVTLMTSYKWDTELCSTQLSFVCQTGQ